MYLFTSLYRKGHEHIRDLFCIQPSLLDGGLAQTSRMSVLFFI